MSSHCQSSHLWGLRSYPSQAPRFPLTTIRDTVNHAGFVIANIKRTIRTNRQADRAADCVVVVEEPARSKVLGGTGDLASTVEGDVHDFVAGGDAAVPGAVEGDKEAVIAPGELAGGIKGQAKWGRMGLHFDERLYYSVAVAGMPEFGINDVSGVAEGPAVVAPVVKRVNCFGRRVISQEITPIVGDPDLVVPRVDSHTDSVAQSTSIESSAAAVEVIDPDGSTMGIRLDTIVTC